jgi:hypothetical protein
MTDQDKITAHTITGEAYQLLAHHPGSAEDLCLSAFEALTVVLLEHWHPADPTAIIAAELCRQAVGAQRTAARCGRPPQASAAKRELLDKIDDAKERIELLIVDLMTLQYAVAAYAAGP